MLTDLSMAHQHSENREGRDVGEATRIVSHGQVDEAVVAPVRSVAPRPRVAHDPVRALVTGAPSPLLRAVPLVADELHAVIQRAVVVAGADQGIVAMHMVENMTRRERRLKWIGLSALQEMHEVDMAFYVGRT